MGVCRCVEFLGVFWGVMEFVVGEDGVEAVVCWVGGCGDGHGGDGGRGIGFFFLAKGHRSEVYSRAGQVCSE